MTLDLVGFGFLFYLFKNSNRTTRIDDATGSIDASDPEFLKIGARPQ